MASTNSHDSLNRLSATSIQNHTVVTYNYDANGNRLSRTVTVPTPAEIVVENSTTAPPTDLADDSAALSFSPTTVGQSASLALTIRNTGQASLTGLSATFDGAHSADFSATGLPATLAGGASATVTLAFSPAAPGPRAAALRIASSDADENPFDILLAGFGGTSSEAWRYQHFGSAANALDGADLATPKDDGIPNLLKYALVLDPTKAANADLPKAAITGDAGAARLSILFLRDPGRDDIKIEVEAADGPAGPWTVIATSINGSALTGTGGVVETNGTGGTKSVQVLDIVTTNDAARRFMRVRVSR